MQEKPVIAPQTSTEAASTTAPAAKASAPLRVDVDAVMRAKLGRRYRWYLCPVASLLKRIIHQKGLNGILERHGHLRGADFCKAALADLDITVRANGLENLPPPTQRRVIFASNHPLGGPDGLALIQFMHDYYGGDVYVVVNDLLMAVEPLRDAFVPVNKHGAQGHAGVRALDAALASDNPVLFFPAGLVSRKRNGVIADLAWKKTFVSKAVEYHRDVVPLFFTGHNSRTFYRLARLREKSGLKFNAEMVRLPAELFRLRGKTLTINCGRPVPWQQLHTGPDAAKSVEHIRSLVYAMDPANLNPKKP